MYNKLWQLLIFSTVFWVSQCSDSAKTSHDVFDVTPTNNSEILIEEINPEPVTLDSIESSYEGFATFQDDQILFVDTRLGKIFHFDQKGNHLDTHLGQGEGPREIPDPAIQFYSPLPEGGHLFIGSGNNVYFFNEDFEREDMFIINWDRQTPQEVLARNPDPKDHGSYNFGYTFGTVRVSGNHMYFPLESGPPEHTDFNLSTGLYAEQARVLARINLNDGTAEELLGRLSPIFSEDENVRLFSHLHYDLIDEQTLALTYKPDPHIYLADTDFNVHTAFGLAGREMDTDYQAIPRQAGLQNYRDFMLEQYTGRGFYTSLNYVEERDLLFRSYRRGYGAETDGLQIYRDRTLIGDVDVPRPDEQDPTSFFAVAGYSEPYFYTNAMIDHSDMSITVFRFQLED